MLSTQYIHHVIKDIEHRHVQKHEVLSRQCIEYQTKSFRSNMIILQVYIYIYITSTMVIIHIHIIQAGYTLCIGT